MTAVCVFKLLPVCDTRKHFLNSFSCSRETVLIGYLPYFKAVCIGHESLVTHFPTCIRGGVLSASLVTGSCCYPHLGNLGTSVC